MANENIIQPLRELRNKTRYELREPITLVDTGSGETLGALVNITLEGLMIVSTSPLDTNRIYQIGLRLPQEIDGHTRIDLGIDCLWVKSGSSGDMHWAGCAIIDAASSSIKIIEKLIREYGTESLN